jgi:hypothetical protein
MIHATRTVVTGAEGHDLEAQRGELTAYGFSYQSRGSGEDDFARLTHGSLDIPKVMERK